MLSKLWCVVAQALMLYAAWPQQLLLQDASRSHWCKCRPLQSEQMLQVCCAGSLLTPRLAAIFVGTWYSSGHRLEGSIKTDKAHLSHGHATLQLISSLYADKGSVPAQLSGPNPAGMSIKPDFTHTLCPYGQTEKRHLQLSAHTSMLQQRTGQQHHTSRNEAQQLDLSHQFCLTVKL